MARIQDAFDQFERYDREAYIWLSKRPICDCCGKHIEDEYAYKINDELICPTCVSNGLYVNLPNDEDSVECAECRRMFQPNLEFGRFINTEKNKGCWICEDCIDSLKVSID